VSALLIKQLWAHRPSCRCRTPCGRPQDTGGGGWAEKEKKQRGPDDEDSGTEQGQRYT